MSDIDDRKLTIRPLPVRERSFLVVDLYQLPDVAQDGVWRGAWRVQSYPPSPAKVRCHAYQSQGEGNDNDGLGIRH